ncbi:MAG: hypothetical protein CMB80_00400 [Flammeovirgaceae bacterium]|jgi:hypothetical protein|nr:hypothetical protein [Flammeovirgaceae bacterium]|tara:strand:- start:6168 stop:6449 length:282 start_codon:yes stop_codon:yes gene_type:complete
MENKKLSNKETREIMKEFYGLFSDFIDKKAEEYGVEINNILHITLTTIGILICYQFKNYSKDVLTKVIQTTIWYIMDGFILNFEMKEKIVEDE